MRFCHVGTRSSEIIDQMIPDDYRLSISKFQNKVISFYFKFSDYCFSVDYEIVLSIYKNSL